MSKVQNKVIGALAIVGGAQHITAKLLNFDIVGTVSGWVGFLGSWVPTTLFVLAGAAGVYVGYMHWNRK